MRCQDIEEWPTELTPAAFLFFQAALVTTNTKQTGGLVPLTYAGNEVLTSLSDRIQIQIHIGMCHYE